MGEDSPEKGCIKDNNITRVVVPVQPRRGRRHAEVVTMQASQPHTGSPRLTGKKPGNTPSRCKRHDTDLGLGDVYGSQRGPLPGHFTSYLVQGLATATTASLENFVEKAGKVFSEGGIENSILGF